MSLLRRLAALCRPAPEPCVAAAPGPAEQPPVRTPLGMWTDDALHALLATAPTGSRIGYFAYYPGERTIDDFTGLYVTVTAEGDGMFHRIASNHGRSDAPRTCTSANILAEMTTGRGSTDAFVDHAAQCSPQARLTTKRDATIPMDLISSLNEPHRVEAFGFDQPDGVAHMIEWLGRESDFRRFVTNDVERELYAQTPGAQLMSITCKRPPDIETRTLPKEEDLVVTDVSVTFPLLLRIRMDDGALWHIHVDQMYTAAELHRGRENRTIVENFSVVGHERVS